MLRELYVIILRFCVPSNPRKLFDDHWMDWKDDFQTRAGWRDLVNLTEAQTHQVVVQKLKHFTQTHIQLRVRVLLDLEQRLQSFEVTLKDCQLPQLTQEEIAMVEQLDAALSLPATIREELDFDVEEMKALARFYSLFFVAKMIITSMTFTIITIAVQHNLGSECS